MEPKKSPPSPQYSTNPDLEKVLLSFAAPHHKQTNNHYQIIAEYLIKNHASHYLFRTTNLKHTNEFDGPYSYSGTVWAPTSISHIEYIFLNTLKPKLENTLENDLMVDLSEKDREYRLKMVKKFIAILSSKSYPAKIMSEYKSRCKFRDINTNHGNNLWICNNGILDLKRGYFREPIWSDYLLINSNLRFVTPNTEYFVYLELYLTNLFPNPEMKTRFLNQITYLIFGANIETDDNYDFLLIVGDRISGRSTLFKILRNLLGEYANSVTYSLFTGDRGIYDSLRPVGTELENRFLLDPVMNLESDRMLSVSEESKKMKVPPFRKFSETTICKTIFFMSCTQFSELNTKLDESNREIVEKTTIKLESSFLEQNIPEDRKQQIEKKIFRRKYFDPAIIKELAASLFYQIVNRGRRMILVQKIIKIQTYMMLSLNIPFSVILALNYTLQKNIEQNCFIPMLLY